MEEFWVDRIEEKIKNLWGFYSCEMEEKVKLSETFFHIFFSHPLDVISPPLETNIIWFVNEHCCSRDCAESPKPNKNTPTHLRKIDNYVGYGICRY